MNILIVGGMFPPMRTGTAFYTQNLAYALSSRGHRVTIVTLGKSLSHAIEGGLDVYRLPAFRLPMKGFFKHFQLCSAFPANWSHLVKIGRLKQADVLLLVNQYLDIAFPAAWAATRLRVPLVCSVGTQLQSLNPRRHLALNILDRLICGQFVFPFCSRIVAWDCQIRQYLQEVHGSAVTDKTVIVNYGVNGDAESLLTRAKDYTYKGIILGVGAVSEQRSFVPLVRAFAFLAPEFPGLRLRIVGHVYYEESIRVAKELGVNDRTEFVGELSHDSVLYEMGATDLLYSSLTGKYTGLGTATIEAMLLAVPTVANVPLDLIGKENLVDGLHLMQSLDNSPAEIAARIRPLLKDEALRRKIGLAGRDFVKRHLNWDVVAEDMENVLAVG